MTRARGLVFSLVASACTILMLSPQAGNAQSDAETLADLRACGSVDRERARLACFDGVLAAERVGASGAAPRRGEAAAESGALPRPVSAAAPTIGENPDTARASVAPRRAPVDTDAVQDERAVRASDADEMPRMVTIVEVNDNVRAAARFVTQSGRVLIQTSGSSPRGGYPDVPFEATLEDGALGSLFLGLAERRRVRVRWAD